jgi:serine/threonine protein kinase
MIMLRTTDGRQLRVGNMISHREATSAVYRGELADHGSVAIKVLNTDGRRGTGSWEGWKYSNEVYCNRELRHRNEARQILDHFRINRPPSALDVPHGAWIIVYEYAQHTLRDILLERGGALSPRDAKSLLQALGSGLSILAKKRIVHRDLKPENVLVERNDVSNAKMADFGVALTPVNRSQAEVTIRVGTVDYMAPELRISPRRVTRKTDLYSLGRIVWECLSGELPTSSNSLLRRGRRELPHLSEVLGSALAASPSERPSSARSFVRKIEMAGWKDRLWGARLLSRSDTTKHRQVRRANWAYVDYRDNGGALWIYAPQRARERLNDASRRGVAWRFAEGRQGFWTRDSDVRPESILRRAYK